MTEHLRAPKLRRDHDSGRRAAVEAVLLMADAEARWRRYREATRLLDAVEHAAGTLSPEYRVKRRRWREDHGTPLGRA